MRQVIARLLLTTLFLAVLAPATPAQVVQLPSFSRFSYSGSVLVPDRGSASLGSVSRSSSFRSRRGLGRAAGSSLGAAGASVHATIIDHDAIDRQLRGLPPAGAAPPSQAGHRRAAPVAGPGGADRRDRTAADTDPDAEGKALVRYARRQYRAGRQASAYQAYQMAIENLSPPLAELALQERQRVFGSRVPIRDF